MAPRGNIIFSAGDPTSMVEDITPTIETEVVPDLKESVAAPKGVRFIAAKVCKDHKMATLLILTCEC